MQVQSLPRRFVWIACLMLMMPLTLRAADSDVRTITIIGKDASIRSTGGEFGKWGGWNLWTFGQIGEHIVVKRDAKVTFVLVAAGSPVADIWPEVELRVFQGLEPVARQRITIGEYAGKPYEVTVPLKAGRYTAEYHFTNDARQGSQDRNVKVYRIEITGPVALDESPLTLKQLTDPMIAEHRMGEILVQTKPHASVHIQQRSHAFEWGTAIANIGFDPATDPQVRQAYQKALLKNFNAVTIAENALKWYLMERQPGEKKWEPTDRMIAFADEHDLYVRGHTLLWEVESRNPKWVRELDDTALKQTALKRTREVAARWAGQIDEWDVNNEMLNGSFYRDRLGLGFIDEIFRTTHKADPDAALYLNDFGVIDGRLTEAYVEQVRQMLERGVPLNGIGIQAHMGDGKFTVSQPGSRAVHLVFDDLGQFGLPIKITELGIAKKDNPQQTADDYERFLRAAFAHPAVEGIYLWGFWAGRNWRPDTSFYDKDFNITPAGERYRELVYSEWWIDQKLKADRRGLVKLPAFFGEYTITVEGQEPANIDLTQQSPNQTVRLR